MCLEEMPEWPRMRADGALDWPKMRDDIHAAFERATTSEERAALLQMHRVLMDRVEPHIQAADLAAFQTARRQDYCLLLVSEARAGDQVSPHLLEVVTRREIAAGRMSSDDELRNLAEVGIGLVSEPSPTGWRGLFTRRRK